MSEQKPNIYQRIHAVMQEVDYIKRGSAGQGTGVKYDEVIAKLRPSMIKHGIVMQVSELEQPRKVDEIVAKSGSKQSLYQGQLSVSLINIDNPTDLVSYAVSAHGMDNGDKAPGKLNTYAAKVALVKAFALETGENDESRNGAMEQVATYATQQQCQQFAQLVRQLGADEAKVMTYCCQKIWNCAPVSFAELTTDQAQEVIQLTGMRLQSQNQARQQAAQQQPTNQAANQAAAQSQYDVAAYNRAQQQAAMQPQGEEVPL